MQSQSLESASHVATDEPIDIEQELQSGFSARLIRKKAKQREAQRRRQKWLSKHRAD